MTDDSGLKRLFEQCVEMHADSMYRVAFRLTGCREVASELVQETYLNAWKNMNSLKSPEKMKSWMFAIMRNQFGKLLRKSSKLRPLAQVEIDALSASHAPLEQDSKDQIVQNAIQQLSDEHKLPLLLVSMEGMSVQQAAEVMEVPRGTVLSRLHRGRSKLKEILSRANPDWVESTSSDGSESK